LPSLANLQILELPGMAIGALDVATLAAMKQLQRIDLSKNKLSKFPMGLSTLTNLSYIDLHANGQMFPMGLEVPTLLRALPRLVFLKLK
jgi:Leucine-rich repeat (LRR) protein